MKKGSKMSDESKRKMSEARKGKAGKFERTPETRAKISRARLGSKVTEGTREKIRRASTGRLHSPETKAKMSLKLLGNKRGSGTKGKPKSLESKAKMSISAIKRMEKYPLYSTAKRVKYTSKAGHTYTFRSSWEYKVAEYLDSLGLNWEYELDALALDNEVYLPDFFIFDNVGTWVKLIEVKGYFPEEAQAKMQRFQQALASIHIQLEIWDEVKLKGLGLL